MSFCFLSWVPVVVWPSPFWNVILFLSCFYVCLFASSLHVLVRLSVSHFLFYFDSLVYLVLSFTFPILPDVSCVPWCFPISLVTCCRFSLSLFFVASSPTWKCVFTVQHSLTFPPSKFPVKHIFGLFLMDC